MAEPNSPEPGDADPKGPSLRERAEQIVAELAKRGETRTKDIQKAVSEAAERSSRDRRELMSLIQKEIRRQVGERRRSEPEAD